MVIPPGKTPITKDSWLKIHEIIDHITYFGVVLKYQGNRSGRWVAAWLLSVFAYSEAMFAGYIAMPPQVVRVRKSRLIRR
jgi:hypothetical protein